MATFTFTYPIIRLEHSQITVEAEDEDTARDIAFEKVKYEGDEPIDVDDLEIAEEE